MHSNTRHAMVKAAAILAMITTCSQGFTADGLMEEIIVTARQQSESLRDVPVTIAAFSEEDIDRYNISSLRDAAKMVPNMVIAQANSGNGSFIRLRGIGSSTTSAAFDHSVALNLDGVVVNPGRLVHNAYMDMHQIEILKGPQSLYFGKSATAGVVSIVTNDPGDEFEFQIGAGREFELDGAFWEMVISGPLSDTFGARLAVGFSESDEMFKNYSFDHDPAAATSGAREWFGEESLNARLTLVWQPTDSFQAKLKYSYSEFDSYAGSAWGEKICPDSAPQPTGIPSGSTAIGVFQNVDDCKLNGNTSRVFLHPGLRAGLPWGFDDGNQGLQQETDFVSLRMDWDFSADYTLTAVTGMTDLSHRDMDDYGYGAGVFTGAHGNDYESLSQEIRLASHYSDKPVNFQLGLFWQEVEQVLDAHHSVFNLSILPRFFGNLLSGFGGFASYADYINAVAAASGRTIVAPVDPAGAFIGPDPFTGKAPDYQKTHVLDTDVLSAYFAIYWDINDRTELTFGARYTEEEKKGYILLPYLHPAIGLFGFSAPSRIDGLEFDDDNISPEIAISYEINDEISVFAAYKEGFKSGGVDNSALPSGGLNPAVNGGDFSFLIYESEEADGFEVGMKGLLKNNSLRLNATAFTYEYTDLQVQLFDASITNFKTFNASALKTKGIEFDATYQTSLEGLRLRGAFAWTDTYYSEDFINATNENLKGQDPIANADVTANLGFTLDRPISADWRYSFSADTRYSDDYNITATLNPYEQDSFWLIDAALSIYSADGRHQFNLVGLNLGDEIYAAYAAPITGRIPAVNTGANSLDQYVSTQQGRRISLEYRFTL